LRKAFVIFVFVLAAVAPAVASSYVRRPSRWTTTTTTTTTTPTTTTTTTTPTTTAPVVTSSSGLNATEQALADAINGARAANGLPSLQVDAGLEGAARDHTQNMVDNNTFTHDFIKDGVDYTFPQWIGWYYAGPCAGENIAWGSPSLAPDAAVQMWLNSAPHRANLLSASFTKMGVALVTANGRSVATNDFGC
jgi:uncharacterized protein YkwD